MVLLKYNYENNFIFQDISIENFKTGTELCPEKCYYLKSVTSLKIQDEWPPNSNGQHIYDIM